MSALDEAIEKYAAIVENKIRDVEQAKKKLDKLIQLQTLKQKRLSGKKLSNDEVHEAMELLCWNSFSGCCAPWKACPWHKAVCDAFGVTPEQVYEVKEKAVNRLLGISDEE